MKRGILLLCLVLLSLLPVSAQDDGADDQVVTVYVGSQFSSDTPELQGAIEALQERINQAAEAPGAPPILIETDQDFAMIFINLDLIAPEGPIFIDFTTIPPPPGFLPSPSIVPHIYSEFPLASANPASPVWIDITVNFTLAMSAYTNGNCEATIEFLDRTTEATENFEDFYFIGQQEQTDAYINFYRGVCMMVDDDYESAADEFQNIITIYEENEFDDTLYGLETRLNLAWCQYKNGDTDSALDSISTIIGTQFEWIEFDALLMRSDIHAETGDFDAALDDLSDAEKLINFDDPFLLLRSAAVRISAGDFKGAEGELEHIEKLAPEIPELIYYFGLLSYAQGNDDDALDNLEEYLDIIPEGGLSQQAQSLIEEIEGE
jgi:tetratricopeptide (TPR) repeat protein